MKLLAAAALLYGSMVLAQGSQPPGFHYWSRTDLAKMANALAPQMNAYKFKSDTIANAGNHRFLITHREAIGQSEYHDKESDIVFVQSGRAKLIYGGKMVDAKTTASGESRGTGIKGGEVQVLSPGDVVVIPPKTPHQFVPEGSQAFNYFVVKVTDQ